MGNQTSATDFAKKVQTALPFTMAFFTSLQPAAVQIYFLTSTFLSGLTAYILKQPSVRKFLKLTPLPSPESNELYGRAVKGEISLEALKTARSAIRYEAPTAVSRSSPPASSSSSPKQASSKPQAYTTQNSSGGVGTFKAGFQLPAHISPSSSFAGQTQAKWTEKDLNKSESDADGKPLTWGQKLLKVCEKVGLVAIWLWIKGKLEIDKRYESVKERDLREDKRRQALKRYDEQRKRRLEGR